MTFEAAEVALSDLPIFMFIFVFIFMRGSGAEKQSTVVSAGGVPLFVAVASNAQA